MDTGLNLVLNKIDETLVTLFRERERIVSAIGDEAASASSLSPFVVPFAIGEKRKVVAFEELSPGFWIGFDKDSPPRIEVIQTPDADALVSPPDHHFTVTVDIADADDTPWITMERLIPALPAEGRHRLTLALKAKASQAASLRFELSVPQTDGEDHRFPLGALTLSRRFEAAFLSQAFDMADVPSPDASRPAKIIAFLPRMPALQFTLAYYTPLMSGL